MVGRLQRADIWAFGVVLYEMLTGQRLFGAETIPETLAQVMTREIDLGTLPATTPRHIRTLLARCLVKEPKQRLRDIGDVRLALDGAFETPTPPPTAAATPASPRRTIAMVSAALLAGAVVATLATWVLMRPTPVPLQPMRFAFAPTAAQALANNGNDRDLSCPPMAGSSSM